MHTNYAFYFGATPQNMEDLKNVDKLEGCCGVKLFAGSSTGNLLVKDETGRKRLYCKRWRCFKLQIQYVTRSFSY